MDAQAPVVRKRVIFSLTPRDPKLSHRKVTMNAYPPIEDLEKHCLKKLEAASADVVEDKVQTPLLICLKDVVQLLENGDPAKCMILGEVKTLGPHYKVNFTVDLVLLGAHERTTRLVLASPTSNLEAHDPLGPLHLRDEQISQHQTTGCFL